LSTLPRLFDFLWSTAFDFAQVWVVVIAVLALVRRRWTLLRDWAVSLALEWAPQCWGTADDMKIAAYRVSEPDAGSDVSSLRTRAVYDEATDEWVLNGTKAWATNGGIANLHVVTATVDPALGSRGQASFIIPEGTKGIAQGQMYKKHGIKASHTRAVQMRRRRPRPGVTAAPTTAAFATGAGPGRTALVTTAAFATGARTTSRLPRRPGRTGMSGSFCFECFVRLDGGDDGLGRDALIRDQLPAGSASGRRERCRPQVLEHDHAGDASGFHRRGEMDNVLLSEELGELGLERLERPEIIQVRDLDGVDRAVLVLLEDQDIDEPDRARLDECHEFIGRLSGEVAFARGELDDDEVDRAELIECGVCHGVDPSRSAGWYSSRGRNLDLVASAPVGRWSSF
jgi:hypothetical protein